MNSPDQRKRLGDEDDRASLAGGYSTIAQAGSSLDPSAGRPDERHIEFTLLVAGCRGGKTSFLRLLLDTSDIAPTATKDQLAAVAKFVQGCSGHTNHIRSASVDIDINTEAGGAQRHLTLSLIDTPSLDFRDEPSSERLVSELLRYIDARFAEGIEDERKAQSGDRYVHLCIYFLDPDQIVPPSVPGPLAPLVPRARTNSFSQPDPEPVILEPPVTTIPLLCRPTLPPAEINTIRRLSGRVNVLPVIAKADTLSNDRLATVKMAIRRDLADAGIGFGIFDMDSHYQHVKEEHGPSTINGEPVNGYSGLPNGSSASANTTPPASPVNPLLRLPYALISPDCYSHSDGVPRIPLSRHELVLQYTPSPHHPPTSEIVGGKFIRTYRWGTMDVLDPHHCDFSTLRSAIFHHMETLQKYTREYLFDKFRLDFQPQTRPTSRHSLQHVLPNVPHFSTLSHSTRPVLAIDTAPHTGAPRHTSLSMPRGELPLAGETHAAHLTRVGAPEIHPPKASGSAPRSVKQRTKKITVACNFCRSRKLKCDGGRPACSQCVKRSNPCDYMPQNKRRGNLRATKPDESDSDSGDDRSPEHEDPSLSPEVSSQLLSRRSSNVDKLIHEGPPPPMVVPLNSVERLEDPPSSSLPSSSLHSSSLPSSIASSSRSKPPIPFGLPSGTFSVARDNELPHIATLSLPDPSPATPMSAPTLPAIRPATEQQAAQRKRAATVPGKSSRTPSTSGPKVVACNFCRARKTKCDGAHPACSSCARRSLQCSYVHSNPDGPGAAQRKGGRRASTSKPQPPGNPDSPPSAQSSAMLPTPANVPEAPGHGEKADDGEPELKRTMESPDAARPLKKLRLDETQVPGVTDIL